MITYYSKKKKEKVMIKKSLNRSSLLSLKTQNKKLFNSILIFINTMNSSNKEEKKRKGKETYNV